MKAAMILLVAFIAFPIRAIDIEWREVISVNKIKYDKKCAHYAYIFEVVEKCQTRKLSDILGYLKREQLIKGVLALNNDQGLTLLHVALTARPFSLKSLKLLLAYGANPNQEIIVDTKRGEFRGTFFKGWTAAHVAIRSGVPNKALKLLYKYGADFSKPDNGGWTALDIADYDGHNQALAILSLLSEPKDNDGLIVTTEKKSPEPNLFVRYHKTWHVFYDPFKGSADSFR